MELNDIVYLSLLFFSIGFGYVYRQVHQVERRKWIGTGVGMLVVFSVSGAHIIHPILCTLVNAIIILYVNKSVCHLVSFTYTFAHLVFFRTTEYFGIPYPPTHTNLVQMMLTLKLVGMAFEMNQSHRIAPTPPVSAADLDVEDECIAPTFLDVFHYAFSYAGVLTGPYYKYRTFADSLNKPFSVNVDCVQATLRKMTWIPLYAILFLIATTTWPVSFVHTEAFYRDCSWLYRLWYVTPTFFWFRMRIYIGLTLSECVCTMAGIGAYPVWAASKPGQGPTKLFKRLDRVSQSSDELKSIEYDFNTIYNINAYGSEFCVTFREGMKHWNMCIQYWLAMNIYKRFPNKSLRTLATTFVSAAWHGVYLGYYYCILSVPFYLAVEDVYMRKIRKTATGLSAKIWDYVMWFFKMQGFAYFGFAFHLLTVEKVWTYYNSIYHCGEVLLLLFYICGTVAWKMRTAKSTRTEGEENKVE